MPRERSCDPRVGERASQIAREIGVEGAPIVELRERESRIVPGSGGAFDRPACREKVRWQDDAIVDERNARDRRLRNGERQGWRERRRIRATARERFGPSE